MSVGTGTRTGTERSTRDVILDVAYRRFAELGYERTSLDTIAEEVGIRRPSVLHHFPSKADLYRAVLLRPFTEWVDRVGNEVPADLVGWPRIESVLDATFRFFTENPDFVRLARREAAEGGPVFIDELAGVLRPLFERAVNFLEREMDAGRIRRHDPRQVIFTGYGAIVAYFSDGPLVTALVGRHPLDRRALDERSNHLIEFFRIALAPS